MTDMAGVFFVLLSGMAAGMVMLAAEAVVHQATRQGAAKLVSEVRQY